MAVDCCFQVLGGMYMRINAVHRFSGILFGLVIYKFCHGQSIVNMHFKNYNGLELSFSVK